MQSVIVMTLAMLTFSMAEKSEEQIRKDQAEKEYAECFKRNPCPNDDKQLSELTDDEKHKTYHCRVSRHVRCSIEQEEAP